MTEDEVQIEPQPRHRRSAVVALVLIATALVAAPIIAWNAWVRTAIESPPLVIPANGDPDLAEALRGARSDAMKQLRSGEGWGEYGKLLLTSGYLPQARTCFTQAEHFDPDQPRWPYLLGMALVNDDPAAAVPYLLRGAVLADQREPENFAPRLRAGEVLLQLGRIDEAAEQLELARKKAPEEPAVHHALGMLALARGDRDAVRRHFHQCTQSPYTRKSAMQELARLDGKNEQIASFAPDQPWPDPYLEECQSKAVRKPGRLIDVRQLKGEVDFRQAADKLVEIIHHEPDGAAYIDLAHCLLRLRDLTGADYAVRTALRIGPDGGAARFQFAEVQFALGDAARKAGNATKAHEFYDAANEAARSAVQFDPQSSEAHELLGLALWQLDERDEAAASLREAVRLAPDRVDARIHLGEALTNLGEIEEAREVLKAAEKLAPQDARVKAALERLDKKPSK